MLSHLNLNLNLNLILALALAALPLALPSPLASAHPQQSFVSPQTQALILDDLSIVISSVDDNTDGSSSSSSPSSYPPPPSSEYPNQSEEYILLRVTDPNVETAAGTAGGVTGSEKDDSYSGLCDADFPPASSTASNQGSYIECLSTRSSTDPAGSSFRFRIIEDDFRSSQRLVLEVEHAYTDPSGNKISRIGEISLNESNFNCQRNDSTNKLVCKSKGPLQMIPTR